MASPKHQILLTRAEIYDLCDALTFEVEHLEILLSRYNEAPQASRQDWQNRIPALRELSRKLLVASCSGNREVA